jgi:hypothetical protein
MNKFENSKTRIVVAVTGWVWVGKFSSSLKPKNSEEERNRYMYYLDDAYCIRVWGSPEGLGRLCYGPLSDTILDPIPGRLSISDECTVLMYDCDDKSWDNHGKNLSKEEQEKNISSKLINSKTIYKGSEQKIVIIDAGWVLFGRYSFDNKTRLAHISDQFCVKLWGTKRGLGEICNSPTKETVLEPIDGIARVHESKIIATYDVNDVAWDEYRAKMSKKEE